MPVESIQLKGVNAGSLVLDIVINVPAPPKGAADGPPPIDLAAQITGELANPSKPLLDEKSFGKPKVAEVKAVVQPPKPKPKDPNRPKKPRKKKEKDPVKAAAAKEAKAAAKDDQAKKAQAQAGAAQAKAAAAKAKTDADGEAAAKAKAKADADAAAAASKAAKAKQAKADAYADPPKAADPPKEAPKPKKSRSKEKPKPKPKAKESSTTALAAGAAAQALVGDGGGSGGGATKESVKQKQIGIENERKASDAAKAAKDKAKPAKKASKDRSAPKVPPAKKPSKDRLPPKVPPAKKASKDRSPPPAADAPPDAPPAAAPGPKKENKLTKMRREKKEKAEAEAKAALAAGSGAAPAPTPAQQLTPEERHAQKLKALEAAGIPIAEKDKVMDTEAGSPKPQEPGSPAPPQKKERVSKFKQMRAKAAAKAAGEGGDLVEGGAGAAANEAEAADKAKSLPGDEAKKKKAANPGVTVLSAGTVDARAGRASRDATPMKPMMARGERPSVEFALDLDADRNKGKSDKEALEDISERKQLKFDARAEEQQKSGKDELPPVKSLVRTKSVVFGTDMEAPATKLAAAVKNDLSAKQQIRANVEAFEEARKGVFAQRTALYNQLWATLTRRLDNATAELERSQKQFKSYAVVQAKYKESMVGVRNTLVPAPGTKEANKASAAALSPLASTSVLLQGDWQATLGDTSEDVGKMVEAEILTKLAKVEKEFIVKRDALIFGTCTCTCTQVQALVQCYG